MSLTDDGNAVSLVKRLVGGGLGSRRWCAQLIVSGRISINGVPALSIAAETTDTDRIAVDGRALSVDSQTPVYLAINKPKGVISSVGDPRGRRTVIDLIPSQFRVNGLVPAGRLDFNSTGLMILTNDGALVDGITHPRYQVQKEYLVTISRPLDAGELRKLQGGISIEGGVARALRVERTTRRGVCEYAITLVEGKKREIRLMLASLGVKTESLCRIRIGNLTLDELGLGKCRSIRPADIRALRDLMTSKSGLHRAGRVSTFNRGNR